ncbi:hypothetical protein QBC38DRAFT_483068 [Podospora fimiseda]|uniref:Secreted protein n=1 Tax=Podospora fimiseda TaxID=252190 RepID=A0AAN7BLF3_9PEZI|nr:hypothetical protein QBC38DRAFT_483068 [Podospora fimiseda]
MHRQSMFTLFFPPCLFLCVPFPPVIPFPTKPIQPGSAWISNQVNVMTSDSYQSTKSSHFFVGTWDHFAHPYSG